MTLPSESPDIEWKDGDDTAIYDQGWEDAVDHFKNTIEKVLENPQLDIMPASMALRVLAASINLTDYED